MDNDIRVRKDYPKTIAEPALTSVEGIDTEMPPRAIDTDQAYSWGWLPSLSLTSAIGILLVEVADTLARSAAGQYEPLFWSGLLLIIVPIAARLASSGPLRRERIGLIILLGLGFYLVKVLHSPYGFTFSDELIHSYNGTRILETGRLFSPNTILAVTPFYPGLETVTAALASLSGLSVFDAGLAVVGFARLIAMLALFLFFEKISGSLRLAGIAALFYAMNANFLFWSAQFSYESLALPLALWVLFVAVRRITTPTGDRHRGLTIIAMLGILAVVITHHLTSYFLVAFFWGWTVVLWLLRYWAKRSTLSKDPGQNSSGTQALGHQPGKTLVTGIRAISDTAGLALFSTLVTLIWLVGVASITPSYLSPVLSRAASSVLQILGGVGSTRELFQSSGGYVAPPWERFVGLGSVVLMLLALPFALREIWQDFRRNTLAIILTGGGLAYFGMLGLRLSPEAWETGNRASEFLFIGLAFVMALAIKWFWDLKNRPWLSRTVVLVSLAIILMGGVISGWAPKLRLSGPIQVNVENAVIRPQGYTAADWMRATLGPGNKIATDESNARLLLAYGDQLAWAGRYPDVYDLLRMAEFPDWQVEMIREWGIQYAVVDRRLVSWDNMEGYYFDRTSTGQLSSAALLVPDVYGKFDRPPEISRLFDSGNIVIYDLGVISNAKITQ